MAKLGVSELCKTPELIVTKFGMGDITPQAEIQTDRPSGAVPANE